MVSSFRPTSFVPSCARLISIDFPIDTVAAMTSYDASARYRITGRAGNLWSIMPNRMQNEERVIG